MTGPHDTHALSRRRLIAAGAAAAALPLAGCSAIVDWAGDLALDDVNVANATNRAVAGSVTVTDPAGDVVLDESFDIQPDEDDGDGSDGGDGGDGGGDGGSSDASDGGSDDGDDVESQAVYEDVWTDAGEYEVEIAITDGADAVGAEQASETVTIDAPDEEKLLAVLGDEESFDEPIALRVFENLSEVEEFGE